MRILVVEDNPTQLQMFGRLLEQAGHDVLEAGNGQQAWEILQHEIVQMVITDWMMPDIDGLELIQRVRGASLAHYIYVLLLTVRDTRTDMLVGFQSGADDYVTKPVAPDELLARVVVGERMLALETNLRTAREQLRFQATHDYLTGLLNRRAFYDAASRELVQAQRRGQPLSLLLIDVDHFKQINNQYGHLVGDQVLQMVAQTLSSQGCPSDRVARWGGEEFLVILPNSNHDEAMIIAEQLRMHIAATPQKLQNGAILTLQVSAGVSTAEPDEPLTLDDLLLRVDRAIYKAKHAGRNQVRSSDSTEPLSLLSSETPSDADLELLLTEARAAGRSEGAETLQAHLRLLQNAVQELRSAQRELAGWIDWLQRTLPAKPAEQQQVYHTLHEQQTLIAAQIADLLDFLMLQQRRVLLQANSFVVSEVVTTILAHVQPHFDAHHIALSYQIDPQMPAALIGDEARFKQILATLLTEIVGDLHEHASCHLDLSGDEIEGPRTSGNEQQLYIVRGIIRAGSFRSSTQLWQDWRRFFNQDGLAQYEYSALALNLVVCQQLAHLMGGTIRVSDEGSDQMTFSVTLPLNTNPTQPETYAEWLRQSSEPVLQLANKRVLLLDPDPIGRLTLARQLEAYQMQVWPVASQEELVQWLAQTQPFDLMLVVATELHQALMLPEYMDRFTAKIIPLQVILVDTPPDPSLLNRLQETFAACLMTPLPPEILISHLRRVLLGERQALVGIADTPSATAEE